MPERCEAAAANLWLCGRFHWTKTPFKRGTDISKIVRRDPPDSVGCKSKILTCVFNNWIEKVCVPLRYGMMLAANNEFFQGVRERVVSSQS